MRLGRGVFPKAMKLAVLFIGVSFVFSFSSFGVVNIIKCKNHYNLEKYNKLHQRIKKRPKTFSIYNLGIVSLCLGKEAEGMVHLQKASDAGHIAATHLLGLYFKLNRSFDSTKKGRISNQEDFNSALNYYEKAAQMIKIAHDYPEGVTPDMRAIEYHVYTSYYVFATIPELYFTGYNKALEDTMSSREKVSYVDTRDALKKMRYSAEQCVQRPALLSWYKKKEKLYQVQQIRCGAYLNYARGVLTLEEQRIKIAQNCENPLNRCSSHQEVLDQINQIKSMMNQAIDSIPAQYLER